MSGRSNPKSNVFLSRLNPDIYGQLLPELQLVPLPRDWDIYQKLGKIDYIYFPIGSIVAVVKMLIDGTSPEYGLIGIDVFLGVYLLTNRVIVQSAFADIKACKFNPSFSKNN